MIIFRKTLKSILELLSKAAIKKHNIEFVVVVGWYGTDMVKEGIYQLLSEKFSSRRNTDKIWWDFSIPLLILGYKDKKYSFIEWLGILCKSIIALLVNPKNHNKIVLDVDLADKETAEFWSRIISPEVLVITSYKEKQSLLIHSLVRITRASQGDILVAGSVNAPDLERYESYRSKIGPDNWIESPNKKYKVSRKLPSIFLEIFAAVVSVVEKYDWTEEEIIHSLSKYEGINMLTKKIKKKINE